MLQLEVAVNPLMPTGYDFVFGLVAAVAVVAFVVGFAVLIRKRDLFSPTAAFFWFLGIVFFPVLGSLFLLLYTRGKTPEGIQRIARKG